MDGASHTTAMAHLKDLKLQQLYYIFFKSFILEPVTVSYRL